jgi:hypothetical protein
MFAAQRSYAIKISTLLAFFVSRGRYQAIVILSPHIKAIPEPSGYSTKTPYSIIPQ